MVFVRFVYGFLRCLCSCCMVCVRRSVMCVWFEYVCLYYSPNLCIVCVRCLYDLPPCLRCVCMASVRCHCLYGLCMLFVLFPEIVKGLCTMCVWFSPDVCVLCVWLVYDFRFFVWCVYVRVYYVLNLCMVCVGFLYDFPRCVCCCL